jgi:membrane protease YdiL (CAAX protease family)
MNIFVNPNDNRVRAGWRLLLQFVLFLLLVFSLMIAKNVLITESMKIYDSLTMGIAGIISIWVAAKLWDRRNIKDYGLAWSKKWAKELTLGLILGFLAMGLIFFIEWSAGWIEVVGFGWERSSVVPYPFWILSYLISMIIIGFYEELIFRGYQIINMVEGFYSSSINLVKASALAILISSIIFGLLHAGNANATLVSTLNIMMAGIMLAVPFLLTGRLAISIGIHISWNFIQGGLFGFAVSGMPFRGSIIQIKQKGTAYITGGSFGPEAGLLGLFGILFILALVILYIRKQNESISIDPSFKKVLPKSVKQDERRP